MDTCGLQKNRANYIPLSPVSFLLRTARVYPNRTAVVYGARRLSWAAILRKSKSIAPANFHLPLGGDIPQSSGARESGIFAAAIAISGGHTSMIISCKSTSPPAQSRLKKTARA